MFSAPQIKTGNGEDKQSRRCRFSAANGLKAWDQAAAGGAAVESTRRRLPLFSTKS